MTQRQRILQMLRDAGPRGIHSFGFYQAHLPRAAARIEELRRDGHNITSEKAGKGCRYRLVEVGAGRGSSERASSPSVDLGGEVAGRSTSPSVPGPQGAATPEVDAISAGPSHATPDSPGEAAGSPVLFDGYRRKRKHDQIEGAA